MGLRWENMPVPEGHVAGIVIGAVLQLLFPPRLRVPRWMRHGAGWPLVLAGAGLSLWAAIRAGETDLSAPHTLVTGGPYAFSRNPMYVGWTLIHLGVGLVTGAAWIPALLPLVVAYTHLVEIRKEEDRLEEQFGDRYRDYRGRVARYVTVPSALRSPSGAIRA
jgi:protein-S-isoprenylcysteine O-methyltransferase Ste14